MFCTYIQKNGRAVCVNVDKIECITVEKVDEDAFKVIFEFFNAGPVRKVYTAIVTEKEARKIDEEFHLRLRDFLSTATIYQRKGQERMEF